MTLPRLPSDVAEPHRARTRRRDPRGSPTICSANHFEAPITFDGVHGLVRRDQHEALGAGRERRVGDVRRADHVGEHRLLRMRLQDRHVLVRGGVEHHVRASPVEDGEHPLPVADVGEDRERHRRRPAGPPAGRAGASRRGPGPGATAGSKAATCRAISEPIEPPAPGDHDPAATEHRRHRREVGLDLLRGRAGPRSADRGCRGRSRVRRLSSRTDGSTRSGTSASSHSAATSRITSLVADGIASSTSSTSWRRIRSGMAERGPRPGSPAATSRTCAGRRRSRPTGSSMTCGFSIMSWRTIAPASPAPTTRTRRARADRPHGGGSRTAGLWKRMAPNATSDNPAPRMTTTAAAVHGASEDDIRRDHQRSGDQTRAGPRAEPPGRWRTATSARTGRRGSSPADG